MFEIVYDDGRRTTDGRRLDGYPISSPCEPNGSGELKMLILSWHKKKVVVIYTTAGTHPIQNDYSHGSRFPCQKVYIHGCRASSINVLFTRQPFLIPKSLYTRLPCIKYKTAIYTAAVSQAKCFYTRLPFIQYKIVIYTAAIFHEKLIIYTDAMPPI